MSPVGLAELLAFNQESPLRLRSHLDSLASLQVLHWYTIYLVQMCCVTQLSILPAMSASVFSLFSLLTLVLLLLLCVIRKKRKMEGKYRPSAEEKRQSRATAPERPRLPLPLPKEERLI